MSHIGSEAEKVDSDVCKLASNGKLSCVYVLGVLGMAEYQTHYSIMVKTE